MLDEAKREQFGDQPIGQGNILVWKVLMHVIWNLADGTIADEFKGIFWIRLDFEDSVMIRLSLFIKFLTFCQDICLP
jgi:hypothetical protein